MTTKTVPPLIAAIRAKRQATQVDIKALEELEAKRRDQLLRFKAQLFDTTWADMPANVQASWDARWEKMNAWILEHEEALSTLVSLGVDRPEWHCTKCGAYTGCFITDGCIRCAAEPDGD